MNPQPQSVAVVPESAQRVHGTTPPPCSVSAAIRKALHHKEDWPCVLVEALAKSEIECCRLSRLAEYRKRRIKKLVRMKTPNAAGQGRREATYPEPACSQGGCQ